MTRKENILAAIRRGPAPLAGFPCPTARAGRPALGYEHKEFS
jgi:hypothetical protein